jgi:sporulation protein YlmC with PRC-barrel domain
MMYLVIYLAKQFKRNIISRMKLEGKEVYTEIGGFLGKISSINKDSEVMIVQTQRGQKIDLNFSSIANIGDKLIIKY